MKSNSQTRLAGTLAIVMGVAYIAWGATEFGAIAIASKPHGEFLAILAEGNLIFTIHFLAWLLIGLAGLGVVPAVSDIFRAESKEWMRWSGILACLSFALLAMWGLGALWGITEFAESYSKGNEPARSVAPLLPWVGWQGLWDQLDPRLFLRMSGVTVWTWVVNVLSLRTGILPRPLAVIGIALGVVWGLFIVHVGFRVNLPGPVLIVAMTVLAPIWFLWIGLWLWRPRSPHAAEAGPKD